MPTTDLRAASVNAVRKIYPGGRVALDGITLTIDRRAVTAIAGPNGSGKTTLLKMLAGALFPSSGSIEVLGLDPTSRVSALRSRVAFASQDAALDPEMTGAQTLRLFAALYGIPKHDAAQKVQILAEAFQLTGHLDSRVQAFSGGLRRRLHLAIAFLHDPELLLLDEPTAGLDPSGRELLWALIRSHASRNTSAVLVTHDLHEAERYCDRVAILARGNLLALGSPKDLIRAHSGWTIELILEETVAEDDARVRALASVDGVTSLRMKDRRVLIELGDDRQIKHKVLSRLSSVGLEVSRFRTFEPDLPGAYFRLTGESTDASPAAAAAPDVRSARGGRGRRREAAS
jgi:ABC-2 type transport system ATP-binding protein